MIGKKIKIKCPYEDCKYEWETSSKKKFVSCPSCLRKINVKDNESKNK